jgi:hypothetical protein
LISGAAAALVSGDQPSQPAKPLIPHGLCNRAYFRALLHKPVSSDRRKKNADPKPFHRFDD